MTSTASDLLKLELQGTGDNDGTWGTKANTVFSRIEEAISGMTTITLAGSNYTLDDTQYVENTTTTAESHLMIIKATGTPGATRQVIVPLRTKLYLMWNATTDSSDMTVGGASGDTVTIPSGYLQFVFCDATNVEAASVMFTTTGAINMNGQGIYDANGNELIAFTETSSAVNYLTLANSATGNALTVTASGSDTNIDINVVPKGSGHLQENGTDVALTGKQAVPIPASGMYTATTNGAATGSSETSTNAVMLKTWDFDASTDEYVQFQIPMPKSWNESTITAKFYWSHASTTTNFGVAWGIQGTAFGDSDALDASWGTGVVVTDTGGTTDDLFVTSETSAVTIGGTPAAEDMVIFRIYRDVSDTADTMAIDARLHGVRLFFTTDVGNDA